jgi:hypothetical protein
VHALGRPEDRIHGASLNALGAADAFRFPNDGHEGRRLGGVEGSPFPSKQGSQSRHAGLTTGGAKRMGGAAKEGFGVRAAAAVATLAALGLGQGGVEERNPSFPLRRFETLFLPAEMQPQGEGKGERGQD